MPWHQTCVIARVAGIREDPVASVRAMVQLGLFYARYKTYRGFRMNTNPQTEREVYQTVPFTFEDQLIRMVLIDAQPWFVAQDIGKVLGLAAYRGSLQNQILEGETKIVNTLVCGKKRKTLLLSVSGLNRLIFSTKKPIAEKLNLWLLTKVLLSVTQIKMAHQIENLVKENSYLQQLLAKSPKAKFSKMDEAEKSVIREFREAENLSFDDIAKITGRSRETVRRVLMEAENE